MADVREKFDRSVIRKEVWKKERGVQRRSAYFDIDANFLRGIPHELDAVVGRRRLAHVHHAVTEGHVDLQQPLAGPGALPGEHLFAFRVLQTSLVEANAYRRLEQKVRMSLQRRCSTVWATHIFPTHIEDTHNELTLISC